MLRASSIGRPVLLIVVVLVVTVAVLLALLWLVRRRLIYVPAREPLPAAAEVLPGGRDVTLRAADGLALGGWYVPGGADGYTGLVLRSPFVSLSVAASVHSRRCARSWRCRAPENRLGGARDRVPDWPAWSPTSSAGG
jgi:hypothetical protein